MNIIVTVQNVTEEKLDNVATTGNTSLGMYELEDFNTFKAWAKKTKSKWTFDFKASRVDREVGRILINPKTDEARAITAAGRVKVLVEKFHWLKPMKGAAEKIIALLDTHPHLRDQRVRDYLLANRRNQDLLHHFEMEKESGPRDRILTSIVNISSGDNNVLVRNPTARKRQLEHMREMHVHLNEILNGATKPEKAEVVEETTEEAEQVVAEEVQQEAASDENYALQP